MESSNAGEDLTFETSDGRKEDRHPGKTVQQYIDETPFWSDGTEAPFTPMTAMQWRIWALATAGSSLKGWRFL